MSVEESAPDAEHPVKVPTSRIECGRVEAAVPDAPDCGQMACEDEPMAVNPLWARRARAYLRDCLGYAGIAALEVPLGLAVSGTALASNAVFLAVVSSVPPAAACLLAARSESGSSGATWGKRAESLRVVTVAGEGIPFGRALWRNLAKIFLPWTLGHVVAFGAAQGGFDRNDPLTLTATALIYAWLLATALMASVGSGRTPHDHASGTRVQPIPTPVHATQH